MLSTDKIETPTLTEAVDELFPTVWDEDKDWWEKEAYEANSD